MGSFIGEMEHGRLSEFAQFDSIGDEQAVQPTAALQCCGSHIPEKDGALSHGSKRIVKSYCVELIYEMQWLSCLNCTEPEETADLQPQLARLGEPLSKM